MSPLFHLYGYVNKQNCHIWGSKHPSIWYLRMFTFNKTALRPFKGKVSLNIKILYFYRNYKQIPLGSIKLSSTIFLELLKVHLREMSIL